MNDTGSQLPRSLRYLWQMSALLIMLFSLFGGCGEVTVSQINGCETCPDRCLRTTEGSSGKCVECITDKHCQNSQTSPTKKCLANHCICGTNADCPSKQICSGDPQKGKAGCVECLKDSDCLDPQKPVCSYNECVACRPKQIQFCEPKGQKACKKGIQKCSNAGEWGVCENWLVCKEGEKCVNEKCVPDCPEPPPCTEEGKVCTTNATDDLPGRYKICKKNARGCFELTEEKSCGPREYCAKGACIPFECPKPECHLDETQCVDENNFRVCEKDKNGCLHWSDKKACEAGKKCRLSTRRCVVCEPGSKRLCYTGPKGTKNVGICRAGEQKCADDGSKWEECKGEILPRKETCNGLDDDCNNVIDDNLPKMPCDNQTGRCAGAVKRCGGSQGWLKCTPSDYRLKFKEYEPKETLCDGLDNDCDGKIDNNLKPPLCKKQEGVCKGAKKICDGKNGWKDCDDKFYKNYNKAYETKETLCDGKDNNCDGLIDETFIKLGSSCELGVGECKRTGKWVCSPDHKGVVCNATPGKPSPEFCDGKDNDCDGKIDENLVKKCYPPAHGCVKNGSSYKCKGICKSGVSTCSNGRWSDCRGYEGPKAELPCNRKDDDCNGKTDEVSCQIGYACSGSACRKCTQPPPTHCPENSWNMCTRDAPCPKCRCGYVCHDGKSSVLGYAITRYCAAP